MTCFQLIYPFFSQKFCHYRWLWTLVIIISIITTKAEQNSYKEFFGDLNANNTDYKQSNDIQKTEKNLVLNSTQKSFSRPSTVLKELWSSASKADNISNNTKSDNSLSFALKLKDFLFRPTKWSSDIVPSIPLSLQLSSDAINLSPHLKEGKSSTSGDITVLNGFSSSISYPPKDYKLLNNKSEDKSYESKLNLLNGVITPNSLILTTRRLPTDTLSTVKSIENEAKIPSITNTTTPLLNTTIPTKIVSKIHKNSINNTLTQITTTATIMSSTEHQKRLGELTPTMTTIHSFHTKHPLTQRPKLSPSEMRRLAIRQRFGQPSHTFGTRISRTPPKVSIDNFLSVYKPSIRNQLFSNIIKSRVNSKNENTTKFPKSFIENTSVKPKLLVFNKINDTLVKSQSNQTKGRPLESRSFLSSLLLFPSRPKPFLKPRTSNITEDYTALKNFFFKNSLTFPKNDSNSPQNKNIVTNKEDTIERRNDHNLIKSVSKNNGFGYRKKVFEKPRDVQMNRGVQETLQGSFHKLEDLGTYEEQTTHNLPLENPQFNNEDNTHLIYGDEHQYIPPDDMMGAHRHYLNRLKIEEELRKRDEKLNKLPNPQLFKEEFNSSKKVKPTLPNRVMQFEEMMKHLAAVMRSIKNMNPVGRALSQKYKEISTKLKFDLMANKSKGPYARFYPPGVYDDVYSPDPAADTEKYRRSDDDMSPIIIDTNNKTPNNYSFNERMDDINTDTNNSYTHNDYDEDGLIRKSFGYRVTVYRSPENGESNVTEEVLDDENDFNSNKSDDLSVSESSDQYSVTTDTNNNGTEYLMTSASNLLRGESQSGLKGSAKGLDYKRSKYDREKGSHAREELSANKSKKVDTHDRRANNERALKERTIIEFFEREQILDTAYNKDKLGIDKTNDKADDQHTSGSQTKAVLAETEQTIPINGTLKEGEVHEFANSDRNHVTNAQSFDTIFPEHDRKYKHKDNAHKYKGWKERGYKIVTETEFVDRGRKVDTGYKRHINGSRGHIKEHSAGDVTNADFRKYHKNVKNVNKNYEALYGKRVKSPQNNYRNDGKNSKGTVLMNADDYRKYYYNNNNGITSGESQVREEHKPYDSTEQTLDQTEYETTSEQSSQQSSQQPSQQPSQELHSKEFTSGDPTQDVSTPEQMTTNYEKSREETTLDNPYTTEITQNVNSFTTDNFQAPPVDTENYWRPITSKLNHFGTNHDYYQMQRPYNHFSNYINHNNRYNNVYSNENTNENYDQNSGTQVNNDIDTNKSVPTISSESFGSGNNPYSMPLVSEEVQVYTQSNNADINPNVPHLYKNEEYFYKMIPNDGNRPLNQYSNENHHKNNRFKGLHKTPNDVVYDTRNYHKSRLNDTRIQPEFVPYPEPQLTPNYPPMVEIQPTAEMPINIPTNHPYYNYQVYPPDQMQIEQEHIQKQLENVPKGRPLFAIIGDESKNIENIRNLENVRNRKTITHLDNQMNREKAQHMFNVNPYSQTLTTPLPLINNNPNFVRPIKINTMLPGPVPVPQRMPVKSKQTKITNKKKNKNTGVFPAPPLMAPLIDNLFLNSNPFANLLGPLENIPLNMKLPLKLRTTRLPPTHLLTFDPKFVATNEQPIAILQPNNMLTLTTTSQLKNLKMNNKLFGAQNNRRKPHHLVINPKTKKKFSNKRSHRSTPFKNKWFSQKYRKKRRSFGKNFSFRNWFKSRF